MNGFQIEPASLKLIDFPRGQIPTVASVLSWGIGSHLPKDQHPKRTGWHEQTYLADEREIDIQLQAFGVGH